MSLDKLTFRRGEGILGTYYLSFGLLLMNLRRLRQNNFVARAQAFLTENIAHLRFPDQDLYNCFYPIPETVLLDWRWGEFQRLTVCAIVWRRALSTTPTPLHGTMHLHAPGGSGFKPMRVRARRSDRLGVHITLGSAVCSTPCLGRVSASCCCAGLSFWSIVSSLQNVFVHSFLSLCLKLSHAPQ